MFICLPESAEVQRAHWHQWALAQPLCGLSLSVPELPSAPQFHHHETVPMVHHGSLLLQVFRSSDGIIKMQLGILILTENTYQKKFQQDSSNYVLHAPCNSLCHTFSCPWTFLSCFWASAAWRLAWLSWISISFRSPSIFFLILRASFLLLTSESRVASWSKWPSGCSSWSAPSPHPFQPASCQPHP